MASTLKRTLQGAATLAVVWWAAGAHAQNLETPDAAGKEAAAPAPAAASGPSGFGDGSQFVLSAENLFGFTYVHPSIGNGSSNFTILANAQGTSFSYYNIPRLALDMFVTRGISAGLSASFFRTTSNDANLTGFQIAPRVGYQTMVGPWLAVWPRLGVTYVYSSSKQKYMGLTVDGLLAIVASPHVLIPFGPTVDVGLTGSGGAKYTTAGVYFGLAVTF